MVFGTSVQQEYHSNGASKKAYLAFVLTLTWSNAPDVSYCNPILFSSKANSGSEQENRLFYRVVTSMLTTWLSR